MDAVASRRIKIVFAADDSPFAAPNRKVAHDVDIRVDFNCVVSADVDQELPMDAAARTAQRTDPRDGPAQRHFGVVGAADPNRAKRRRIALFRRCRPNA